jgi:hypothetical protein
MKFAIVNEAADPTVAPALGAIAEALAIQSARDFPLFWESQGVEVSVFPNIGAVPADYSVFHIADAIPEAPDALAYHTVVLGRPTLKLGWETIKANGGSLTTGGASLSSAMSHEICETIADPYCSWYGDWPADPKKKVCLEVCDPVEGDSYEITTTNGTAISVSNFVGPRWFDTDAGAPGPFDYMSKLAAPLTMSPGGYLAFDDGTQVYGDAVPQHARDRKAKYSRRA